MIRTTVHLRLPRPDPIYAVAAFWFALLLIVCAAVGLTAPAAATTDAETSRVADGDPRWWLAYLGSLALSAWWNWAAYGDPLVALGVPWAVALGVVVLGDIAPELALVRRKG